MLNEFVEGTTPDFVRIVEVLDSNKLLKRGASEFSLFNKFSFSAHVDRGK